MVNFFKTNFFGQLGFFYLVGEDSRSKNAEAFLNFTISNLMWKENRVKEKKLIVNDSKIAIE